MIQMVRWRKIFFGMISDFASTQHSYDCNISLNDGRTTKVCDNIQCSYSSQKCLSRKKERRQRKLENVCLLYDTFYMMDSHSNSTTTIREIQIKREEAQLYIAMQCLLKYYCHYVRLFLLLSPKCREWIGQNGIRGHIAGIAGILEAAATATCLKHLKMKA